MAATYTEFESIRSTTTTQADATTGPVHIGSLLPQVLARYGIVLPRDQSAVTSARLRRRMRHSHTHQAPAISPRPNSPLQDRPRRAPTSHVALDRATVVDLPRAVIAFLRGWLNRPSSEIPPQVTETSVLAFR